MPDLTTLIDLGTNGILLFLLWQVWTRLNTVTDALIGFLQRLADMDEQAAQSEAAEEAVQRIRAIK